jgi:hypothetical protein
MQNIKVLGNFPFHALPIHGSNADNSNPSDRIIDFALKKYLDQDEADTVINGYRRSPWNEDALNVDIAKLNSSEHSVPKDEHYWNAIKHVHMLIKPEVPLRPVHFADLRRYKWRLSTNIGAPFAQSTKWQKYVKDKYNHINRGTPFTSLFSRDLFQEAHRNSEPLDMTNTNMSKHNLYSEAFYITRKNIHLIKEGHKSNSNGKDLRYWNTAFARQHLVKSDAEDKVRLVFGAPFTLLTAELMFIWPLQVHLLHMTGRNSTMLWGFETIQGGWYRLRNFFSRYAPKHDTVITLDWSGFDRTARHSVIRDIHQHILRPIYDFDSYHPTKDYPTYSSEPGEQPIPQRLQNLWDWMTDSVLTIPLLLPNGDLLTFLHSGIFSGYFQTQILDSLYNKVMIFTILSRMGFDLKKVVLKVQGDDSIILLLCCFILIVTSFMTLFQHYATYYFGATVSKEKSEIRQGLDDAEVLKYRNKHGIPYRDELSLLAQLRHPERSKDANSVAARCIGIAYASCGQLPRTYMICEDVYKYVTSNYDAKASQKELNRMFQHLDIELPSDRFPTLMDTMAHLMDNQASPASYHWPQDYFLGLPGRTDPRDI